MASKDCRTVIVKTLLGMEKVAAALIREIDPGAHVEIAPLNFKGLVLVKPSMEAYKLVEEVEKRVPEAEKVLAANACTKAEPLEIARVAADIARNMISSDETFAVRTTRRGRHNFSSIDVNVVVGDAVKRATGAQVNLDYPDKIVAVEIIQDRAYIAILPGSKEWRKKSPDKKPLYMLFSKISVIQMPYLGPLDACRTMGVRVGREVQNFEVRELVVAPIGAVDARQLAAFIEGVLEGIETRYSVQQKSYGRRVRRVTVLVQDLYQLVRERGDEPIIVFEPEGRYITRVADDILNLLRRSKRVNLLFGSREGIPKGVYRVADLVVDIAPGITLSTEYAAAAALTALATVLHDKLTPEDLRDIE